MRPKNQDRIKTFKKFTKTAKDDENLGLITKFFHDVQESIVNKLQKEKNMNEESSIEFMNNMFSAENKRLNKIREDIEKYFKENRDYDEVATLLLSTYYELTANNMYNNPNTREEITEISESASNNLEIKKVPISLFWNFISKVKSIGVNFELDTVYVSGEKNSINNDNILEMYSNDVIIRDVYYEFKYSKSLGGISTLLNKLKGNVSFFIIIDKLNILNFGLLLNGKRYFIGKMKYRSSDINKLSNIINTSSDVNIKLLSKSFISRLHILNEIENKYNVYIKFYENMKIYKDIINNKITLILENDDNTLLNKNRLLLLISEIKGSENIEITQKQQNNKTIYYTSIK